MKDIEPTESDKRHNANTDSGQSKGKMSKNYVYNFIQILVGCRFKSTSFEDPQKNATLIQYVLN